MAFGLTREDIMKYYNNNQQKVEENKPTEVVQDEVKNQSARDYISTFFNNSSGNEAKSVSTPKNEVEKIPTLEELNNPNIKDNDTRNQARNYISSFFNSKNENNGASVVTSQNSKSASNSKDQQTSNDKNTLPISKTTDAPINKNDKKKEETKVNPTGNYYQQKALYEKKKAEENTKKGNYYSQKAIYEENQKKKGLVDKDTISSKNKKTLSEAKSEGVKVGTLTKSPAISKVSQKEINQIKEVVNSKGGNTRAKQKAYNQLASDIQNKYGFTDEEMKNFEWDIKANVKNDLQAKEQEVAKEFGAKHPVLGTVGSVAETLATPLEASANLITGLATGDNRKLDNSLNKMKQATREGVASNINNNIGKTAYNLGTGLADLGAAMVGGAITGINPVVLMGLNAGGNAQQEALENGSSVRKASVYGAGAGALDAYMNKYGLDFIKGDVSKAALKTVKDVAKVVGKGAVVEGLENVAQDIGQTIIDELVNKGNSNLRTMYSNYIQNGASEKEALDNTVRDYSSQLLMSGGTGALFGGVFSGINAAKNMPKIPKVEETKVEPTKVDTTEIDNLVKKATDNTNNAVNEIENLTNQIPTNEVQEVINERPQVNNTVTENIVETPKPINEFPKVEEPIEQPRVQNENINPTKPVEKPIVETPREEVPNYVQDILNESKVQTPEMRERQNANPPSQVVTPKELASLDIKKTGDDIRRNIDSLEMSEDTRSSVLNKVSELENILDEFNNSKNEKEIMSAMDKFEKLYSGVENELSGNAKTREIVDYGNSQERKALVDALRGRIINVSGGSRGELTDLNIKDLNNAIYGGYGSGRFAKKSGVPIDTVFGEIDAQTGNALSRFMIENGLDPSVTENQVKGIVDYANYLKSEGKYAENINDYTKGGLLGGLFDEMIRLAGQRGLDIDENELRKKMKVSAFRTNKQGVFGLTDEELNNEYFNKDNEHFLREKGSNKVEWEEAQDHVNNDYDGTKSNFINKPTNEHFTPTEVFEGAQVWFNEIDKARETNNYSDAAEVMYRMTLDASDKGSGLQAYAALKKDSPIGVVLEANSVARDMAVDKLGKDYVKSIDKAVVDIKKVLETKKSFEEQAKEVERIMRELQTEKGFSNGINGFEQMKEAIKSASLNRSKVEENLKQAGKIVTVEDFMEMLKTSKKPYVEENLNQAGKVVTMQDFYDMLNTSKRPVTYENLQKYGKSVSVDDFYEMLKTGKVTKEQVIEDLHKVGKYVSVDDFYEALKTGKVKPKELVDDLNLAGKQISLDDFNKMLESGKNIDSVGIKDILYAANKMPNLDAKAQGEIARLAQEMYGKDLTSSERQKYINQINVILSGQQNFSIADKATEVMHILMLSGTKTHIKNFLANVGMLPEAGLARKISAIGENAIHLFNPDYKPTNAFKVSKKSKSIASQVLENIGGIAAIEEGTESKHNLKNAGKIGANYMFGTNGNVLSKANKLLTDKIPVLRKAEDLANKGINKALTKMGSEGAYDAMDSRLSLFENYRQFIYGSLSGLEDNPFVKLNFEKRLASYIEARGIKSAAEVPQDAIDIARAEALKATFKDDNAIVNLVKSFKKIPILGELQFPFPKTPANLVARGIEYSPLGIARELYGLLGNITGEPNKATRETLSKAIEELSKGISGTIVGGLGMYLYSQGILTGKKSDDTDMAKYMEGEGWKPYSISSKGLADYINKHLGTNLDLGDYYTGWSWLQPSTTGIITGIALFDELKDGKKLSEKSIDEIVTRLKSLGGSYANAMLEQSTFQGTSDLFNTSYGQGFGENLIDEVLQMPTRFFSGAINDIAKLNDNTKHEYYSKGKPIETVKNMAISKTPFASKTLPAKYNEWGEEVKRGKNQTENTIITLLDPTDTSSKSENKLYKYVDDINAKATSEQYIPSHSARSMEVVEDGVVGKINLDNKQYSQLSKVYGDTRADIVSRLSEDELFNQYNANTQAKILNKLDNVAEANGKLSITDNAKISDETLEILDIYKSEGSKGIAKYVAENYGSPELQNMADKYGINTTKTFIEKASSMDKADLEKYCEYNKLVKSEGGKANEKGWNAYKDGNYDDYVKYNVPIREAIKNKEKGQSEASVALNYLDSQNLSKQEKGKILFNTLDSNATTTGYADKNQWASVYDFYDNKNAKNSQKTEPVDGSGKSLSDVGLTSKGAIASWDKVQKNNPDMTLNEFAYTYKAIDSKGKKNGAISQDEIITYLNDGNFNKTQANNIWKNFGSEGWAYIPTLDDNGKWKKVKKSK